MKHTIESLEDWEMENGEDVIIDGPFSLTEEDEKELVIKLNKKFNLSEQCLESVMGEIHEQSSNFEKDRLKTFKVFAKFLNKRNYVSRY